MRVLSKIALIVITVLLPISIICIADNGIYRVSDTYRYNFNDTQLVTQQGLSVDVYDVAHAYSGYLMGKQDKFHLTEKVGNNETELFSEEASLTMENVKKLLDVMLILGAGGLLLAIASYVLLLRMRMKNEIRRWFRHSIVVFAALLAFNMMVQMMPAVRDVLLGRMYDFDFEKDELFIVIMRGSLLQQFAIFDSVLAGILMAVSGYIHHMLTKPRKLFFKR